jgi:tRNA pseudouridine38-40 synthase
LNTYKLEISYNGSLYQGWQVQPQALKTIQGQLNHALQKICKSENITSIGSGRTDSGVHALSQVVKVTIPLDIECVQLLKAINSHLPMDIRIRSVAQIEDQFHPVRDALWKRYSYFIYCGEILPPSALNLVSWEKVGFDEVAFRGALNEFVGTHDFKNFSTKGTEVKTTIRTIYEADMTEVFNFFPFQEDYEGKVYQVSFVGNGFLKQMVRLMVGACLMASRGKIMPSDIKSFFQQDTTVKLGPVAPPNGLYLEHVEYQNSWDSKN